MDQNGLPLAGGKVWTYAAGTSTPLATYTTAAGDVANTNPVILDAAGEAEIYLGAFSYKIDLFSALDVHQAHFPVDNLIGSPSAYPVVSVTVPVVAGATLTAAALIPAGARVLTVGTKVLVELGTSAGLTAFAVGDGGIIDKWGQSAALTVNALTGTSDSPAAAQAGDGNITLYPTATSVVLSAIGGLFDNTGSVQVSVMYLSLPYRAG